MKSHNNHPEENYYIRMNILERFQHHLVWTTFVTLAITGFMVEFPEDWLSLLGSYQETVFYYRGLIHRIAAVVMTANLLYQTWYITLTKPGRGYIVDMIPKLQDAKDFYQNMSYYLKRTDQKPPFDRFNYKEKLEYWTGWIGNIIITVTGFFLWFPEYFPKFIFDLSTHLNYGFKDVLICRTIVPEHSHDLSDIFELGIGCNCIEICGDLVL